MKIKDAGQRWGLSSQLVDNLKEKGFEQFFPVQKEVIPLLLRQNTHPCILPQDICVSAPTGSGKTLSYALPIVNTLMKENTTRLRGLVILPSRELAQQVYTVFEELVRNTNVKPFLTTGSRNINEEQFSMTGYRPDASTRRELCWGLSPEHVSDWLQPAPTESGRSLIDVLITTPGRLLDHLQFTEGFTLQHVRFLILDEADRLLGNAYHGWVRSLIGNTDNTRSSHYGVAQNVKRRKVSSSSECEADLKLPLQRLLFSATLTDDPSALALLGVHNPLFVHSKGLGFQQYSEDRVLSSDDDEEDKEVLGWEESFELPPTLAERKVVVDTKDRVLSLFSLLFTAFHWTRGAIAEGKVKETKADDYAGLCSAAGSIVIIFVNSVDASHRLSVLLKLLNNQLKDHPLSVSREEIFKQLGLPVALCASGSLFNGEVQEMSRLIRPSERENIVTQARSGKVSVIVSSDRMARGIDLPTLKLVVNYDAPKHAKTYVHRAGRTARALREGMCVTFLKKGQLGEFRKLREEIGVREATEKATHEEKINAFESTVRTCFVPRFIKDALEPMYDVALSQLSSLVSSN